MTESTGTEPLSNDPHVPRLADPPVDGMQAHLSTLLSQLDDATAAGGGPAVSVNKYDLFDAGLGIGSSLFTALRCKNAATAAHCLRVALGCSTWAHTVGIGGPELDEIEVAALLHDIGKIGVPDQILLKPGKLSDEEVQTMRSAHQMGLTILRSCCTSESILNVVRHVPSWYQGGDQRGPQGDDLPVGARIVSIVNAFDSMTTDQIYRRAMAREHALVELKKHAGTQFDPDLVSQFCDLQRDSLVEVDPEIAGKWLRKLQPIDAAEIAVLPQFGADVENQSLMALVHQRLLDNMRDGVVFVDSDFRVHLWNRGAERLTGIPGTDVFQRSWSPKLIGLCNERGRPLNDTDCPVYKALRSAEQSSQRFRVIHRNGRESLIDLQIVPVVDMCSKVHGVSLLLHDISSEVSLEERCQNLQEKATRDPLTQVANRAELDRVYGTFIETHQQRKMPCGLIICDIDHFKYVNDTFGHQAGDEALKVFSGLLAKHCRSGDLVARYGGEEFVVLCADCNLEVAARRAEEMRQTLSDTPIQILDGRRLTASFGVTEVEPNDTEETMLRRADRALMEAKESGRNAVICIGSNREKANEQVDNGWFSWWKPSAVAPVLTRTLVSPVPLKMAAVQLRGFVLDYQARVKTLDEKCIVLRIEPSSSELLRRESDRPVPFLVQLTFHEEEVQFHDLDSGRKVKKQRTRVEVSMRPRRSRDRRRNDVQHRAAQLMLRLQSYLMAAERQEPRENEVVVQRSADLSNTWLAN